MLSILFVYARTQKTYYQFSGMFSVSRMTWGYEKRKMENN